MAETKSYLYVELSSSFKFNQTYEWNFIFLQKKMPGTGKFTNIPTTPSLRCHLDFAHAQLLILYLKL